MSSLKVNRDFIKPKVALQIAKKTLAEYELESNESLAAYLPSLEVNDVEYEIDVLAKDNEITAANWRSFGGATTSEKWGLGRKGSGSLIGLSRNYTIDEYQRLKQRKDSKEMIGRSAADLITRSTLAIAKQVNYQRGKAISEGKLNIQGSGGMREEIDFGRDPEFNVVAPKLFNDETADPIAYLTDLVVQYEEVNGFRPAEMLMSSRVKTALFNHPKVAAQAIAGYQEDANGDAVGRARANDGEVNSLLSVYDLPPIRRITPTKTKVDDWTDPSNPQTKYDYNLPQDSVLLTAGPGDPSSPLASVYGRTFWGETVSSELPEFGGTSGSLGVPGIVAAVYEQGWPYNLEVISDALVLPVVFAPNYVLKAKVL